MKINLLVLLAGLLAGGCSSVTVSRDYDKSADFSKLKKFAWQHDRQPQTGNPRIDNDINDRRIRSAVEATLAGKGMQLVPLAEADFRVAYFVDYQRRIEGSTVGFGVGAGSYGGRYGRYGGVGYETGISEYEEGNLTIDVLAPPDGKLIWRGIGARAVYGGSDPEKATKIISDAVAKILKKFPPQ